MTEDEDEFALIELDRVAHRGPFERYRAAKAGGDDLTDPRLRDVWAQLMRQDRKTGRFLYPTSFDVGYGTADERQQFAICMLLAAACECPPPAITRQELVALREELRTAAAAVRAAIGRQRRLGLRPVHVVELHSGGDGKGLGDCSWIDPWIETADDLEAKANNLERRVLLINRDRGMQFERAMAVWLARMSQLWFGKVLPGVVGTLVEVVSGHPIEARRVRDWVKGADEE
jgi:hypothetical protein